MYLGSRAGGWAACLSTNGFLDLMRGFGARGVHLGVGAANERAVRFYRAYGFHELDVGPGALVFAIEL